MKTINRMLALLTVIFILFSCTTGEPSKDKEAEDDPKIYYEAETDLERFLKELPDDPHERDDIMTCRFKDIRNRDLWDIFMEDVQNGKDAMITMCNYTTEGDPIYTLLSYSNGYFDYYNDSTRDRFGGTDLDKGKRSFIYNIDYDLEEETNGGLKTFRHHLSFLSDKLYEDEEDILDSMYDEDNDWIIIWAYQELID